MIFMSGMDEFYIVIFNYIALVPNIEHPHIFNISLKIKDWYKCWNKLNYDSFFKLLQFVKKEKKTNEQIDF